MILLDTSFIVSFFNSSDSNHDRAVEMAREIDEGKYGTPMISDYIFSEVATVMMRRVKDITKVTKCCNDLMATTKIIKIDAEAFKLSWQEFGKHNTSSLRFSFVDCSNIVISRLNPIRHMATFDREFEKVGGLIVIN